MTTNSDEWRQGKTVKDREVRFVSPPFVPQPEPDVGIFTAHVGERLVGFVAFDPIYTEGRIVGYTANCLRAYPSAPDGVVDFVIVTAMAVFCREGIARLSLGGAPAYRVSELATSYGTDSKWAGSSD